MSKLISDVGIDGCFTWMKFYFIHVSMFPFEKLYKQ